MGSIEKAEKKKISRGLRFAFNLLLPDWACSCPFHHHCHIYQFIHLHLKPCKRIRRVKKPMWLKRKIKNSKSWNCFQEKNVKGKLTVAQKTEMQAEKKANHHKVSSDLLRPLSAWWGAESSAESLSLTDSWAQGRVGRVNEFCAPTWTAENQGFYLQKTLFFWGRRKERKGHSPEHLSRTEVAVGEFTALMKLTGSGHSARNTKDEQLNYGQHMQPLTSNTFGTGDLKVDFYFFLFHFF